MPMLRRIRWTASLLGILAVSAIVLLGRPAQSMASQAQCSDQGAACIWTGTGFSGVIYQYPYNPSTNDTWIGRSTRLAASLWNYRSVWVSWIASTTDFDTGGGSEACLPINYERTNLSGWYYPVGAYDTAYNNLRGVFLSTKRTSCPGTNAASTGTAGTSGTTGSSTLSSDPTGVGGTLSSPEGQG